MKIDYATIMIILTIILVPIIVPTLILWLTHITMTKDYSEKWAWGSFKSFKIQFEKSNMKKNEYPLGGYSSGFDCKCEFNLGIIKFNYIGMLLNPIDYIRAALYIKSLPKTIPDTFDWEEFKKVYYIILIKDHEHPKYIQVLDNGYLITPEICDSTRYTYKYDAEKELDIVSEIFKNRTFEIMDIDGYLSRVDSSI